jgi:hypothetical protein
VTSRTPQEKLAQAIENYAPEVPYTAKKQVVVMELPLPEGKPETKPNKRFQKVLEKVREMRQQGEVPLKRKVKLNLKMQSVF